MNLVEKAKVFAQDKHKDQKRSDGKPYYTHLERVFNAVVYLCPSDINLQCSAILHDTIEDVGVTKDELVREFNEDVADLVDQLTNKYSDHLEHKAKLAATAEHVSHMSERAKVVKLCDRADNINDTKGWKPARILRYCENTRVMLDALKPIPGVALLVYDNILERVEELEIVYRK